jgi:hypothetical protein
VDVADRTPGAVPLFGRRFAAKIHTRSYRRSESELPASVRSGRHSRSTAVEIPRKKGRIRVWKTECGCHDHRSPTAAISTYRPGVGRIAHSRRPAPWEGTRPGRCRSPIHTRLPSGDSVISARIRDATNTTVVCYLGDSRPRWDGNRNIGLAGSSHQSKPHSAIHTRIPVSLRALRPCVDP